jgi:hypothetical protein
MKKFLPLVVVGTLIIGGFGAVALNSDMKETVSNIIEKSGERLDYTHTVFVEVGTGQFCGPCHGWNANIYNTYNSGQYDFEYVEMVIWGHGGWNDILNSKANSWRNSYGINSIPTSIFDGDYRRIVGNYPTQLPGALDACGARSVKELEASMTVTWLGDAEIQVDIEIENNDATWYNGYIRVPITEITSRYTTAGGSRYHYGFLDWAFNKDISISSGGIYTDSVTWDGDEHQDNHGNDFGDITPENIKVIMGVFNDANDYVDETVAALVQENQPPGKPTVSGPIVVDPDVEYEYSFVATDPDDDVLRYFIEWGDTFEGWLGPYPSGETVYLNHSWSENGTYEVKAKAKDEKNVEGPWSDILTVIVGNVAPDEPVITGRLKGNAGTEYEYTFVSNDPNGDDVRYIIQWGDGKSDTTSFNPSGTDVKVSHTWDDQGNFVILAKAEDTKGEQSDFGRLSVQMPRSRAINGFFLRFLEQFPILQKILLLQR